MINQCFSTHLSQTDNHTYPVQSTCIIYSQLSAKNVSDHSSTSAYGTAFSDTSAHGTDITGTCTSAQGTDMRDTSAQGTDMRDTSAHGTAISESNVNLDQDDQTASGTAAETTLDTKTTSLYQMNRNRLKDKTSVELEVEEKWSAEKAVEMSYKEFCFEGSIIYSHDIDDCNLLCDDIISSLDSTTDTVIGFDTEWPVTYEKGKQARTALIQICLSTDRCYLFHVSCMPKFPGMLRKLLEIHSVLKVGLNVQNDLWKLDTDYDIKAKDIIQKSCIELRTLGNKKLRSAENWSLEGLAKNVLRVRISKDPNVRKCDWRQFPLPEVQQRYAATDAIISLMLYQKLTVKYK